MPSQLVVIDPRVANYRSLIDQLGASYSYLLLSANSDGVTQIANYVLAHPGFDAIHLISHGSPGQVTVGTSTLSEATVGRYAPELNQIGASLNAGGDLLIYGCDVAQGTAGQQLITHISRLTRLDVAASTNRTGRTGDWVLEAAVSQIEYALPALSYDGSLAVSAPTVVWTRLIGSLGGDYGTALTRGLDGSIYIGGRTSSSTVDGQANSGVLDAFITKYAPDGTKVWTRLIGSTGIEFGQALTTGLDGSIYIAGQTNSTTLDGQTQAGSGDAFVTKYAVDGTKIWTRLIGSSGYEYGYALTTGVDGSIYVAGQTNSTTLDGQTQSGSGDSFVTKFSPDGNKVWTRLLGSSWAIGQALKTGVDGSIYVAGQTLSTTLDGQANAGSIDAFVTKYSPDGTKVWTRLIGSAGDDSGLALTIGFDGSIYVAGQTASTTLDGQPNAGSIDAFVTKYSADGTKVWTGLIGSSAYEYGYALTTGLYGSIYVAGQTSSTTLDGQTQAGSGDVFVTKYAADGTKIWTRLIGSSAYEYGYALTTGVDGSIYLGGYTGSQTVFYGQNSAGSDDAFLIKISDASIPPTIEITAGAATLNSSQTATLTITLSESATDFDLADLKVSGGTVGNFTGSGTRYTATFTPNKNSSANGVVSVPSGIFSNDAGNLNVDGSDANNTVTMTVNTLVGPNAKPKAGNSTLTTLEDTALVFTKGNFAFKDSDLSDSLQSVVITALPAKGSLKLGGVPVAATQSISVADLSAGKLAFTPAPDAYRSAYSRVAFKVSDGKDLSTSTYYITVNVTAANDAPTVAKPIAVPLSLIEGKAFRYSMPSDRFSDVDDTALTYSATGLLAGMFIDPKTGKISGTPGYAAANLESNTVTIKATDKAGLSASLPLTVNVTNTPTITGSTKDDSIVAGAGADSISGGIGHDTLVGGAGNDTLVGGAGNDMLTGGDGADQFVFGTALSASNVDTIKDFLTGIDKIGLSAKIFSKFTGSSAGLAIAAGNFVIGAGATAVAKDNDDYLIYDTGTTLLHYDADGNGSGAAMAVVKVELTGIGAVAFGDFLVVP